MAIMRSIIVALLLFLSLSSCQRQTQQPEVSSACDDHEGIHDLLVKVRTVLSRKEFKETLRIPFSLRHKLKDGTVNEVTFTETLCSEYRDNPDMLKRKLEVYANIFEAKERKPEYSATRPIWSQLTSEGYHQLVFLHKHLAYYRSRTGSNQEITQLPPLMTHCEARYQLQSYISKYRGVWSREEYESYEKGLQDYLAQEENCTDEERSHYMAFRGDGSLVPHVMESSTMKSFAYAMARLCRGRQDSFCQEYSQSPYRLRHEVNDQVLKALFYFQKRDQDYFDHAKYPVFLMPDSNNDGAADYIIANTKVPAWKSKYGRPAHNFAFTLIGKYRTDWGTYQKRKKYILELLRETLAGKNNEMIYEVAAQASRDSMSSRPGGGENTLLKRLQVLFDRHADYYRTFYFDPLHTLIFSSASPWSSSSSYIHQSHKFSVRGYANDTMKREKFYWMTIYKVPKEAVYTIREYNLGKEPDFSKYWFKESDFGKNKLAREELALDSLAMPDPSTLEALVWLGDVTPHSELMGIVRSEANS